MTTEGKKKRKKLAMQKNETKGNGLNLAALTSHEYRLRTMKKKKEEMKKERR